MFKCMRKSIVLPISFTVFPAVLLLLLLASFLLKLVILQMLSSLIGIPSLKDESKNLRIY